jgi:hypothetical protein
VGETQLNLFRPSRASLSVSSGVPQDFINAIADINDRIAALVREIFQLEVARNALTLLARLPDEVFVTLTRPTTRDHIPIPEEMFVMTSLCV